LAAGHLDAFLRGLLDVAAPLLVHARQDVVLGPAGERDLEVVRRLAGGEAALDGDLAPPETLERPDHASTDRGALGRGEVAEPADGVVGDPGLDGRGVPPTQHDRRTHPDREGTAALEVLG